MVGALDPSEAVVRGQPVRVDLEVQVVPTDAALEAEGEVGQRRLPGDILLTLRPGETQDATVPDAPTVTGLNPATSDERHAPVTTGLVARPGP